MRWVALGLIVLFGILLAGCSVFVAGGAGQDAAAAALERVSPPERGQERTYVTKPAVNGALVVFRTFDIMAPFLYGYGYLTRAGNDWQVVQVQSAGRAGPPEHGKPILVSVSSPRNPPNYTILSGLLRDEQVKSVHVTFADGQIRMDTVVHELTGVFVEPQNAVCRIKLLDAANNLLFDFELAKNPAELDLDPEIVEWAQKECK